MGKQKTRIKINEAMRLVKNTYALKPYDPKISVANTWAHESAKCRLIYLFKKLGVEVYSEVEFKGGARADLFIPFQYRIIEVTHSETAKRSEEKLSYYPSECDVEFISTEEILKEDYEV